MAEESLTEHNRARGGRTLLFAGLLLLAGVVAFSNTLDGALVFDDHLWVRNDHLHTLWPPEYLYKFPPENPVEGRPVVAFSFAANIPFAKENVVPFHIVNIAIHLLAALAVFGTMHRMLRLPALRDRFGEHATGLAFACALIWMLHPLQTECVNYIVTRTSSLMGLFYFLTFYCALRAWDKRRWPLWTAAAIACSLLGMGSKEVMVTAPFLIILFDLLARNGTTWDVVKQRFPLHVGLIATWGFLAWLMTTFPHKGTVGFGRGPGAWAYLKCQALMVAEYVRLVFWPDKLVIDYGYPRDLPLADVAPAGALVLALVGLTIWALRKHPLAGYAGAWFFVSLAPTSSIVPIATEMGSERRVYVPLAGAVALVVLLSYRGLRGLMDRGALAERSGRWLMTVATILVAGVLGVRSYLRSPDFRDEAVLCAKAADKVPNNVRAMNNLAIRQEKKGDREAAIRSYERTIEMDPRYWNSPFNLALLLHPDPATRERAVALYEQAIPLMPGRYRGHFHLSNALVQLGRIDDAAEQFEIALELFPNCDKELYGAGFVYFNRGYFEQAAQYLEAVVANESDNPGPHNGARASRILLGLSLIKLERFDDARTALASVLETDPDNAFVLQQLNELKQRSHSNVGPKQP